MGVKKAEESNVTRVTSKNKPGLFFIVGFFIVQNECFFKTTLQHLLLSLVWFCESMLLIFALSIVDLT